jgi:voltage-gated potassium channel
VSKLVRRGADPQTIVVIDADPAALRVAQDCGATAMEGDATRNAALEAVGVAQAGSIIVCNDDR